MTYDEISSAISKAKVNEMYAAHLDNAYPVLDKHAPAITCGYVRSAARYLRYEAKEMRLAAFLEASDKNVYWHDKAVMEVRLYENSVGWLESAREYQAASASFQRLKMAAMGIDY
jgi:hypothetical protein